MLEYLRNRERDLGSGTTREYAKAGAFLQKRFIRFIFCDYNRTYVLFLERVITDTEENQMMLNDDSFERTSFALEIENEIKRGAFKQISDEFPKCAYCAYEILPDDEAVRVITTKDILHRTCWCEYAEDNCLDLCTPFKA